MPLAVSRLVQARTIEAGVDGIPVTAHSLRAARATTAVVSGAPIDRITDPTETSARSSTTTSDAPSARDRHEPGPRSLMYGPGSLWATGMTCNPGPCAPPRQGMAQAGETRRSVGAP